MTRLLLVDDHASTRQPLALLLKQALDLDDVVEAASIAEASPQLDGVDVAIVDLGLPDGNGVALIERIASNDPQTRILLLTSSADRLDIARAVDAGAHGVLHKAADIDEVIGALRTLVAGHSLITPERAKELQGMAREARVERERLAVLCDRLTPREWEALNALVDGLTDKEIAARLRIGAETVRTHLESAYRKLGVETRVQAVALLLREGLVDRPPRR
jgi:DNA-binding NarL/FixJ family response regulator